MDAIADKEPAIRKALTVEEIFWQDEQERRYYQMRQDGLLDYRSELSAVRQEGLEKGLEKAAKAALQEGSPAEFMIKITGLSRETVLRLKREVEQGVSP